MKKTVMIGAAALAAAMITGCGKTSETVATVNGKSITRAEIDADVAKVLEMQKSRMPKDMKEEDLAQFRDNVSRQMVQQFITKTLLLDEAAKQGLTVSAEERKKREEEFVKANKDIPNAPKTIAEFAEKFPFGKDRAMKEFEDGILIQKMLEKDVTSKIKVDEKKVAEVLAEAAKRNAEATKSAKEAEPKIKGLKKQLEGLKGEALAKKFAELAKVNSDCPSKEKGGDLGEFTRGRMVKEFEETAFKLPLLTVSEPVKTQFGWHLIMVTKKTPAVEAKGDKPAQAESVQASHILISAREPQPAPTKEQVERGMKRQEEQQALRDYFENLRKNAKIEVPGYPDMMPPEEKSAAAAQPAVQSKPVAKPAEAKKDTAKPAEKPTDKKAAK